MRRYREQVEPAQVVVLIVLVLAVTWALTAGRRRIAPYFMGRRDRASEQSEHEVWMGGGTDGYVPPPQFGPTPRERMKSPPEQD